MSVSAVFRHAASASDDPYAKDKEYAKPVTRELRRAIKGLKK